MAFDFKKQFKELYQPKAQPTIVDVPAMKFLAVTGKGDPNDPAGQYAQAVAQLYAVAYTIRMSHKTSVQIPGFTEFVVPPLEGFWWQPGIAGVDLNAKDQFQWISVIRMPDFVTADTVNWAKSAAAEKKKQDFTPVNFWSFTERLCVQMLHTGPYDDEPQSVAKLDEFALQQGYQLDFSDERHHHEIYLNDPRRIAPAKLKTILRHPIKPAG